MKKVVLLLTFLAGGMIFAGEEDENETATLMNEYTTAQAQVIAAKELLQATESSKDWARLQGMYRKYETAVFQCEQVLEQLIREYPQLAKKVLGNEYVPGIISRSCTPDGFTSSPFCSRASSPAVPTK